jgi:hypothetical protein
MSRILRTLEVHNLFFFTMLIRCEVGRLHDDIQDLLPILPNLHPSSKPSTTFPRHTSDEHNLNIEYIPRPSINRSKTIVTHLIRTKVILDRQDHPSSQLANDTGK